MLIELGSKVKIEIARVGNLYLVSISKTGFYS